METTKLDTCTAFAGSTRVAQGSFEAVVLASKKIFDSGEKANILIFDDETAQQRDADLGRSEEELKRWLNFVKKSAAEIAAKQSGQSEDANANATAVKPGRPKLGVVSREVTLLPRHWDWLSTQPGGASVAIRKLVEAAKRDNQGPEQMRLAREATYRFMSAMGGNEAGFEEASRALFAGRREQFEELSANWPIDVRNYLYERSQKAF